MYDDVIFSAYKADSTYIENGHYFEGFSGYLTNIGNNFELSNGTFTAPRKGIYEFSAAAFGNDSDNYSSLTVQHNDANVVSFWTGADSKHDTLSFNWIMDLQQGDTIRLRNTRGIFYCSAGVTNYNCIFNGKLINV